MDFFRKYLPALSIVYFHYVILTGNISAQSPANNVISKNLSQLKIMSTEMNHQVLSLLSLIKEYEKLSPDGQVETAKIISSVAPVKETDNENSLTVSQVRLNEEYLILDHRDNWLKIRMENAMEGWIQENNAQTLIKNPPDMGEKSNRRPGKEASGLLSQISYNKSAIFTLSENVDRTFSQINDIYKSLLKEKRQSMEADYNEALLVKEKINKYVDYARRFLKPYDDITVATGKRQPAKVAPGDRFHGTVMADLGKSSYTNMGSNSTVSKRLAFKGTYQIDPSMSLDAGINYQNELIQTPFTNTSIETGISKKFANKLQLQGKLDYENYDDKTTATNTFGLFNTGINALYNPSNKANISGNIRFLSKNYSNLEENNYQGVFYAFGTTFIPDENRNIRFQITGTSQFSEKDFLHFNQINPMFNYMVIKNPKKSLKFGIDVDFLKFASSTNPGDYQKYKMEMLWRNSRSKKILSKNLNLTYKSFPLCNIQDYVRIVYVSQRKKGSLTEKKSSSSSFSTILTYIVQRKDMVATDQLDLRWDKSKTGTAGYFNTNIFNRLWNNFEKTDSTSFDNSIDFYTEFGPLIHDISHGTVSFTSLKIGVVFGGHIFYNFSKFLFPDENSVDETNPFKDTFFRNGSSIRGGIAITSAFKIKKASLELAGNYEKSLVRQKQTSIDYNTGDLIYGDNLTRNPSSIQFRIDFRLPVYQNWDIHFNLSTYTIRTDASPETSINPIESKSNLRFSGGLIYRFAL
jgi:hypothetical protein